MTQILALVLVFLTPITANAIIIQVDYAGIVNSVAGTGFGYAIDDPISGTLFIDSTAMTSTEDCDTVGSDDCLNYLSTDPGLVTSLQLGLGDAYLTNVDIVQVVDKTGPGGQDFFVVQNGSLDSKAGNLKYAYEQVFVYDSTLDFITGTGLEQSFALAFTDLINGDMSGSRVEYVSGENGYQNIAGFRMTSISAIYRVPVSVPEPGTLSLLGAGLLGLGFVRRKRAA